MNARNAIAPDPDITFGEFLEGIALPFLRSKWKRSTAATTENRITHHLKDGVRRGEAIRLGLKGLQSFLNAKAASLSRSVVAHLRWDLRAIFKLALAEGYAERDPTGALYTPKEAATAETASMNKEEVEHYINALEPARARHRASGDVCRHAARRDSGLAAPAHRRRLPAARSSSSASTGATSTHRRPTSSTRTVAIPPKDSQAASGNGWSWWAGSPEGMGIRFGEPSKAHVEG